MQTGITKLSTQNQIQLELLDSSGQLVELAAARWLQAGEISSGLVTHNIEINPQIGVDSVLDFGAVYAGVANQKELLIHNTGNGILSITGISASTGEGQLVVEPTVFNVAAASSQRVTVSLIASPSFSTGSLQISSNDSGSPQTVSVSASIEALPAVTSSQVLTVAGVVSGVVSGQTQVKVRILNKKASLLKEETRTVEGNGYRLTWIDLTDPESGIAGLDRNHQIEIQLLSSGKILDQMTPRSLTPNEISSGLVVQDFEVVLTPEIEVASVLDFGRIYAGLVHQKELQIGNSGSAQLEISAISGGSGLSAAADYPLTIAAAGGEGGSSQRVTVSLRVDSLGSYSQDLLITHTEGQTQTVSVRAEVEALAVATSTQVLTVSGRVSGVTEGTITVEILNGSTSVMQQQTAVKNGRYRLTLLDLSASTPALAPLSTTNRIEIGYQQGQLVETEAARPLLEAEIASGLVVQDFEIVLLPQIQVAPT
ncbi:MAG: choice-of-anchor D domain-containing protein, partial [Pseudomonadales bacterium]|nr:choice-of-anchor D domain-containing protein [Pseudomonadales bacterium]